MKTKPLMIASCIFLGALGLTLTFMPEEISASLGVSTNPITMLLLQLLGAMYLGFTMLNWMTKTSFIGGIYNKPIAAGNLMHFVVGAFALLKVGSEVELHHTLIVCLTVVYAVFALLFAYVFRTNPASVASKA